MKMRSRTTLSQSCCALIIARVFCYYLPNRNVIPALKRRLFCQSVELFGNEVRRYSTCSILIAIRHPAHAPRLRLNPAQTNSR